MNTKHTPGPWKTRRFDNEADGRHNLTVYAPLCEIARMSQVDQDVAEANAHLIAAAPELLEELIKCRNVIAHCISELPQAYKEAARTQMNKASDVIAKATGTI